MVSELTEDDAVAKMRKGRRQAYRLDQTALVVDQQVTILRASDDFGWPDLNVSLASGKPCELAHRAIPDLWISMALNQMDVAVAIGGREQNLIVPADRPTIIAPESPWSVTWRNDIVALNVFVKGHVLTEVANELFESDVNAVEVLSKVGVEDRSMAWLLYSLKEALYEPQGHANLKVDHISRALAADILRKHVVPLHEAPVAQGGLTVAQTKLVADYIREHLPSKIVLKDLTALIGLTQTIFIQRFTASFGMSPHRYVTEARIGRARKLLKNSNLPIVQIATLCGFADQSHLTAAFRRIVGLTPARYRQ